MAKSFEEGYREGQSAGCLEERANCVAYLERLERIYRDSGAPSSADALSQAARVIGRGSHTRLIARRPQVVLHVVKR
jgi:hypothetical protein